MGTKKGMAGKSAKLGDNQMTGLAGELFVAAELLRRGVQASITFGNAKSVDLLAYNAEIDRTFPVQVKAIYKKNAFLIAYPKVKDGHVYVFVLLNSPSSLAGEAECVRYFVVPGATLVCEPEKFGKFFKGYEKNPGINWKLLEPFEDNWKVFGERV